jgi:Ca-activated chloride channel family protein
MLRQLRPLCAFGVGLGFFLLSPPGEAAAPVTQTLSPYFFVDGGEPDVESLPLKDTQVRFDVAGTIADVTVKQTYENRGRQAINARYVFPASTRAAVHGLKMTIGDRVIEAQIRERAQAHAEYEAAKRAGKSATLLDEERPNVFTMNVANILPGDRIDIELRYTELLVPEEGVYEFVYPTVVGPRYAGAPPRSTHDLFVRSPYLRGGQPPTSTFHLEGSVNAGVPIKELSCPSHKIVAADTRSGSRVSLDPADALSGNRDFILRYRLSGDRIESGLSLYQGKDENYFMLMVQPPQRPRPDQIPRREYVFIVDVSGSMNGFPLDVTKDLLHELIGSLRPTDRFNVLLFSGASELMSPASVPATREQIAQALAFIDGQRAGGGTELLPALKRAMSLPRSGDIARSFVVVTDGYIDAEEGVFHYIRDHLGQANVFSFGIGSSVNRFLIEGVAHAGLGEPFVVTGQKEASQAARRFASYVRAPVLSNVQVSFDGFDAYDVEPRTIPTVFAERPLIIRGKWRGAPGGTVRVSGVTGGGKFEKDVVVGSATPGLEHRALKYLWARTRIDDLSRLSGNFAGNAEKVAITELGLKYHLLTEYTSFVAVDDRVRSSGQGQTDVAQALPMPEGVGNEAIAAGPEPEVWLLAMVLTALALIRARRSFFGPGART